MKTNSEEAESTVTICSKPPITAKIELQSKPYIQQVVTKLADVIVTNIYKLLHLLADSMLRNAQSSDGFP